MFSNSLKNKKGFTLVELSIVIIIIGFLIAGVSSGQSLIKQAQLNTVINDFVKFKTGIVGFTSRYDFPPGDFPYAYQYWGSVDGCTNTDANVVPHNGCNGNGDGNLGYNNVSQNVYEGGFLMWKHLQLAGFLAGNYSGLYPAGTAEPGIDLPAGALNDSGYYGVFDTYYGLVPIQDMINFGSRVPGDFPYGAILKPIDAKGIDTKLDDGFPITGVLVSGRSPANAAGSCSNGFGSEELTGATEYALDSDNIGCRMLYIYHRNQ